VVWVSEEGFEQLVARRAFPEIEAHSNYTAFPLIRVCYHHRLR
jgi:hypothetical protein